MVGQRSLQARWAWISIEFTLESWMNAEMENEIKKKISLHGTHPKGSSLWREEKRLIWCFKGDPGSYQCHAAATDVDEEVPTSLL